MNRKKINVHWVRDIKKLSYLKFTESFIRIHAWRINNFDYRTYFLQSRCLDY